MADSEDFSNPHSPDAPFSFSYFMYKLNWHFLSDPDTRLIESLFLQLIFLITFTVNCCSVFSIIKHISTNNKIAKHWSVAFSLSCLFLSILVAASNFLLLIYQQDGRHFDAQNWLCKSVIVLLSIFVFSLPISIYLSIKGYLEWKTIYNNFINSKYGTLHCKNLKWIDIPTGTSADMDMRFLVAIRKETDENEDNVNKNEKSENETLLLNETTNQVINENNQEKNSDDSMKLDKNSNYKIAFAAHKGRWALFLFGLFIHIILGASIQYKNWNEEKQSLYQWGYRFSRLLDTHDLAYAKYQRKNGIPPIQNEKFDDLDFLEYWARTQHRSH